MSLRNSRSQSPSHQNIRQAKRKSSLINALTGQEVALVSDVAGTTTDPVKKAMEIPGWDLVFH